MHSFNAVLGSIDVLAGAALVGIAVPLLRGRIPPNHWYGIRIRAAFASDEAWYRINRHGGKSFACLGVATALTGVLIYCLLPPVPSPGLLLFVVVVPLLLLVPTMIHVHRHPKGTDQG